jgi:flagellar biosynthesis protein FlhF
MQIKRFEARDMAEALKMIKREFGPQAVILSARDITKGKGMLGLMRRPGVEVTAATDTHNGNEKPKVETFTGRKWTLMKEASAGSHNRRQLGFDRSRPMSFGQRGRLKRTPRTDRERSNTSRNDTLIRFLNLYDDLLNQGVEEDLASSLIERLREGIPSDEVLGDRDVKIRLKGVLQDLGVADSTDRTARGKHRVVVLVGPTGVGKSTTIAKMAVAETFQKGRKIALITLNDHRIGATAQMEAYGNILKVPVSAVSNRKELKECLRRFRDKELILIDTPGISHNDIYGINELKTLLEVVDSPEIHLLAAAGTRGRDFESVFKKFGVLPIDWLLFTKIDETVEYGSMLNAVNRAKLPVSYFTNGQDVPENIEEGSVERLIDLLCREQKRQTRGSEGFTAEKRRNGRWDWEERPQTKKYVANKNSDLFHHPSCKWVERIDKRNMVVFKTRSEALANDFRPCRACQPLGAGEEDESSVAVGALDDGMRESVAY